MWYNLNRPLDKGVHEEGKGNGLTIGPAMLIWLLLAVIAWFIIVIPTLKLFEILS